MLEPLGNRKHTPSILYGCSHRYPPGLFFPAKKSCRLRSTDHSQVRHALNVVLGPMSHSPALGAFHRRVLRNRLRTSPPCPGIVGWCTSCLLAVGTVSARTDEVRTIPCPQPQIWNRGPWHWPRYWTVLLIFPWDMHPPIPVNRSSPRILHMQVGPRTKPMPIWRLFCDSWSPHWYCREKQCSTYRRLWKFGVVRVVVEFFSKPLPFGCLEMLWIDILHHTTVYVMIGQFANTSNIYPRVLTIPNHTTLFLTVCLSPWASSRCGVWHSLVAGVSIVTESCYSVKIEIPGGNYPGMKQLTWQCNVWWGRIPSVLLKLVSETLTIRRVLSGAQFPAFCTQTRGSFDIRLCIFYLPRFVDDWPLMMALHKTGRPRRSRGGWRK